MNNSPIVVDESVNLGAKSLAVSNRAREDASTYDFINDRVVRLSRRERCLAEAWKRSHNYFECVRVLKAELGVEISNMTCRRWLARPHVVAMIKGEVKARAMTDGYTKEMWVSDGLKMKTREGRVGFHQVVAWKELGKACGYYEGVEGLTNNIQINFTQRDGSV